MTLILSFLGAVVGARIAIWQHERGLRRFHEWEAEGLREFGPLYEAGLRNIARLRIEGFKRPSFVIRLRKSNKDKSSK